MAGRDPLESPDDFVYHYTTTAGLIGILSSNQIWLTNAGHLNDAEELVYGATIASKKLRESTHPHSTAYPDTVNYHYAVEELENMASHMDAIASNDDTNVEFPYIASFSSQRDRLSQWRGYAEGGYSIAFHRETLASSIQPVKDGKPVEFLKNIPRFGKVLYGKDAEELMSKTADQSMSTLFHSDYPAPPSGVNTYYNIKYLLNPTLALLKHPSFNEEQEWRIYATDLDGDVKFRSSPLGPVPYTEVQFDRSAIAEVMASPGPNSLRRIRGAHRLLQHNGFDNVHARESSTPFIG